VDHEHAALVELRQVHADRFPGDEVRRDGVGREGVDDD